MVAFIGWVVFDWFFFLLLNLKIVNDYVLRA